MPSEHQKKKWCETPKGYVFIVSLSAAKGCLPKQQGKFLEIFGSTYFYRCRQSYFMGR